MSGQGEGSVWGGTRKNRQTDKQTHKQQNQTHTSKTKNTNKGLKSPCGFHPQVHRGSLKRVCISQGHLHTVLSVLNQDKVLLCLVGTFCFLVWWCLFGFCFGVGVFWGVCLILCLQKCRYTISMTTALTGAPEFPQPGLIHYGNRDKFLRVRKKHLPQKYQGWQSTHQSAGDSTVFFSARLPKL